MKKYILLCLSIILNQTISPHATECDNACYVEKKYCKGCNHYHYQHYDVNELDEHKLRGTLIFEYRAKSIADSDVKNGSIQHLEDVLKNIEKQVERINEHTSDFKIKIDFSENYLKDKSIKELDEFLRKNNILQNHLIKLDLRNNRLTDESFDYLDSISQKCSKTKINISSNEISLRKFRKRFGEQSEKIKFKVQ